MPPWVWGVLFRVIALFNCSEVDQFLHDEQVGEWHSYVFGERSNILLSFVAKTALAWQVYVGPVRVTLRGWAGGAG